MPACFQLYRKSESETAAVPLNIIDKELCEFLGEPVDPVRYVYGWYDWIGFLLAIGKDWDEIRATAHDWRDDLEIAHKVIDWFEANFVPNSFYQYK